MVFQYCVISDRPEVLASEVATGQSGVKAHTAEVVEGYDNWKNQCVYKCATCPDFKAKLEAEFAVHLMMNHQVRAIENHDSADSVKLLFFKCKKYDTIT